MWAMKRKTIRNHDDFLTTRDDAHTRSPYFFVKTKLAKYANNPRYGLVASKRVFRHAVERNRAKRLLRDWISFYEHRLLDEFDYIFIANRDILSATRDQGRRIMRRALQRIRRYNKRFKKDAEKK